MPCLVGLLLWTGATALLCEDALRTAHVTINHALQPLLTAGTVAAAVYCHHRLASLRLLSGAAFLALALLGSVATVYGTLSRTATARDAAQADAMASNRQLALKSEALEAAKREAARECKPIGPRCKDWLARVDQLTQEMAPLRALAVDPRAVAIGNLAELLGFDGARTKAVVGVLDPVVLPLFLELGSLVFFAVAFPHCRNRLQLTATPGNCEATVDSCAPWTQSAGPARLPPAGQLGRPMATRSAVGRRQVNGQPVAAPVGRRRPYSASPGWTAEGGAGAPGAAPLNCPP